MEDETKDILLPTGQVRPEKVEDLLVEVSTGKHLFERTDGTFTLLASRNPNQVEQENARIVYTKALQECRRKFKLKTRSEMEEYCLTTEDFDKDEAAEKKNLILLCQKLSQTREKTNDPQQKIEIDVQMMEHRERLIKLETTEEQVYQYSAENQAEAFRTAYLVATCTSGGEMLNEPIWKSWSDFKECSDFLLVCDCRRAFLRVSHGLPVKIIRAIARTSEWRSRWKSVKESGNTLFDGSAMAWDKNKLNLIYWSDFYDSVYEHPECPREEVIRNDEALQEWLSQMVAKRNLPKSGTTARQLPTLGGKVMQRVSSSTTQVNQPYRVRM